MIAAVDVGFGRTKAVSSFGNFYDFPSLIGKFKPVIFSAGMENSPITSRLAVSINRKDWYVGEAAIKQSTPQNTIDPLRTVSEEGIVLLISALAILAKESPGLVQLVTGLPVAHYQRLKDRYIAALGGCTYFTNLLAPSGKIESSIMIVIEESKVIPQPMGTYFDVILDDEGQLKDTRLAAGKVGIIDIGYNTLDLARVDELEFVSTRSTSFSGMGIFASFQALSTEIYRNLSLEVPPEKLEPLVKSKEIMVAGKSVSIEELKKSAFQRTAAEIVSRVKSTWPDRWELERILITGGGAVLLSEYLLPEFEGQASLANAAQFANVNGYLKFGKRIWSE